MGAKWVDPSLGAELVHDNRRRPPGLVVHSDTLLAGETTTVGGIAVTSPARTAFDIGRRTPVRRHAVQRLDALANATGVTIDQVAAVIAVHRGARGLGRLQRVLPLVDAGAESPQETRTRLVLTDSGLPKPETQIVVCDEYGQFVARVDWGYLPLAGERYRELRVGIEYDGVQHWTDSDQCRRDIDRQVALTALGWVIIHVTGELPGPRRATLVARVEDAMYSAGWAGRAASVIVATSRRRVAS